MFAPGAMLELLNMPGAGGMLEVGGMLEEGGMLGVGAILEEGGMMGDMVEDGGMLNGAWLDAMLGIADVGGGFRLLVLTWGS